MDIDKVSPEEVYSFLNSEWSNFFNERGLPFNTVRYSIACNESQETIGAATIRIRGGICKLEDIFVRKDKRRMGVGQQLLTFVEQEAARNNCRRIIAETSEMHEEAMSFYIKNNFSVIAEIPEYYYNAKWFVLAKELL